MVKELPNRRYFSSGEICEMYNISHQCLDKWIKNYSTITFRKSSEGKKAKRLFNADCIKELSYIYYLLNTEHLTTKGARRALMLQKPDVVKRFSEWKAQQEK